MWYLDDGTLVDDCGIVINELKKVIAAREKYGLELNLSKCEAHIANCNVAEKTEIVGRLKEVAPSIRFLKKEELCRLGSP